MIFVTVGTHEQSFNRLIKAVDGLIHDGSIEEEVIIQTGYSDYVPQNCEFSKFYPYQQMMEYIKDAHIVITHGGPSSFLMPLQVKKIPIVVPRKKEFGEHVNDHQLAFCREIQARLNNILLVEDIEDLLQVIKNYNNIVSSLQYNVVSNNDKFCAELAKIVDSIMT